MIDFVQHGDFKKVDSFFERLLNVAKLGNLDKYGKIGVDALKAATPVNTGATAASWDYRIDRSNGQTSIVWTNSHINQGVNIAIILQYGHGTGTGGYVQGIDYINPAIQPIFEEIAENIRKEVNG